MCAQIEILVENFSRLCCKKSHAYLTHVTQSSSSSFIRARIEGITSESFTFQSMIRGCHLYKEVWDAVSVVTSGAASTAFTTLLAAAMPEAGTSADSGPSGSGKTDSTL